MHGYPHIRGPRSTLHEDIGRSVLALHLYLSSVHVQPGSGLCVDQTFDEAFPVYVAERRAFRELEEKCVSGGPACGLCCPGAR